MKVLIVEDQEEKSEDVVAFFQDAYSEPPQISIQQSLRSGLRDLITNNYYDLIILDMSMPSFDPSEDDPMGASPESFAGKEFLSQMALREISVPVVVLTQYAMFEKGQVALDELDSIFRKEHSSFYLGSIYYTSAGDSWRHELQDIISKL